MAKILDQRSFEKAARETGEEIADQIIAAHCKAMSQFLGVELSVVREGQNYRFVCKDKYGKVLNFEVSPARLPS